MQLKLFQEQIFFATVRITVGAGVGTSIGTGFLYSVPVSPDKTCILLVSNRHVYVDPGQPINLLFHKRDPNDPSRPMLGEFHAISGNGFEGVYTGHPNSSVDLACINVSQIAGEGIFYKNLTDSMLADFSHESLLPGNEVWFIGYPENRFDTKHNLPILRRGYIASIPKVGFEGHEEFLVDAQVLRGSSGSPVFTVLGGEYKLIGVVAQTMIKNEKLQTVPAAHAIGIQQTLGLGIVLRASLLKELLSAATAEIRARFALHQPEPNVDIQASEQAAPADG
ncbi:MAG: trypsin-like peptidase domain-containing protein [Planctomycetota bacterium]|nr:trypsin-like peptidase domain-containing protein [Planctomycetota bacterium]MDE2217051.1 trypsin-like peptidase domain-containing protein [Planctomycetota bacterium]